MSPFGRRDQAVASEPSTGGQGRLHFRSFLLLAVIFTLTGTATAGAQETPKQPPAVHSHPSGPRTSPAPVETPAPAPADDHSEHATKTSPVDTTPTPAPADEHSDHTTKTTLKETGDGHSRGLVLGGFAALNASILLAAAGVRRRDPKRQRARASTDG